MAHYKVVEKFISLNGEGILVGQPAVFIRFHGCNLSCSFCDTSWANEKDTTYDFMTEEEIYEYIKGTGIKNVTLTGGEPLLVPNIAELLHLLSLDTCLHVEIETNGSIDLSPFAIIPNSPSFTMDYKLPGSLMEDKMLVSNFEILSQKDTVKFVVGSREDLNRAREVIYDYDLTSKCHVLISPVYGKIKLDEIADYLIKHRMNNVAMQLQMHKIIWGPDRRGV
ncbi:7-carboxy-7-deazaguanine synthase [Clostridium sp. N3C]|uniref:putative 7-carboxy-7-deazaguanine synthase QueE n=1 Tax=Clostridium sp. N3C TaxID=1776758 RepID=UPI00092DEB5E|nr:putative 7-carboxy-7-deazaguanine synthase QueE [Clostridium sp. N3C]SCN25447.1 7-carboxy-7-deazaguanine synthase [Clostridium sp. N3C]